MLACLRVPEQSINVRILLTMVSAIPLVLVLLCSMVRISGKPKGHGSHTTGLQKGPQNMVPV